MDTYWKQCANILDNAHQYRIYKLDCAPTISTSLEFRVLVKGEVDVNRFMSKHSSDHHVAFKLYPLSHLSIDASLRLKLMHTTTFF